MRGSLVKLLVTGGVITELKNTSGFTSSTPSAVPVALSKERIRPLTATMNWDGPAAPIEAGGNAWVASSVAPVKLSAEDWPGAAPGSSPGPPTEGVESVEERRFSKFT